MKAPSTGKPMPRPRTEAEHQAILAEVRARVQNATPAQKAAFEARRAKHKQGASKG